MHERKESGLSVKAFCEGAGIHENSYYYWQKKLREAACGELSENQGKATSMAVPGFIEARLAERPKLPTLAEDRQGQISIETSGVRITASSEYPADKLAALLREVMRPC
jgi:transposase-like protein